MAISTSYIINGVRSDGTLLDDLFIVPFKFSSPEQLVVTKNGELFDEYTLNGNVVRLGGNGWSVDDTVKFELAVVLTLDEDLAVFAAGSSIRAADLNDNFELLRKAVEELKAAP